MLKIINTMSQLDAEQLMAVYLEGNLENGRIFYPELSEQALLQRAEAEFLSYLREDFFLLKDAVYAVWAEDGYYLSALRLEPYRDGLLLEALETAPDARRKGYGFQLMSKVLQYLQTSSYKMVYSHINKRNTPSLKLHEKCGFKRISESAVYIDGTVTQNSCTMCFYL